MGCCVSRILVNSTARARFTSSASRTSSLAGAGPTAIDATTRHERIAGNPGRLEQFHNERALSHNVKGGIYFHPSDDDLSQGTPVFHPSDDDLSPETLEGKCRLTAALPRHSDCGTAIAAIPEPIHFVRVHKVLDAPVTSGFL